MNERLLLLPAEFDRETQAQVGLFAAQLNLRRDYLIRLIQGLTVPQLEWQPRPGENSIGMLLAHIAITEVFWLCVAPYGIETREALDEKLFGILGLKGPDDGMPLEPGGTHPSALLGKTARDYEAILETTARASHQALLRWKDAELEETYQRRDLTISKGWTAYHTLEHLVHHLGQIALLKRLGPSSLA